MRIERVEILCIGDELLDGRTRDANLHQLGGRLARQGISLARATVVGDAQSDIIEALNERARPGTYLLVSGGLGPTEDDRTRFAAAAWMGVELEEDGEELAVMHERFSQRGLRCPEINRVQVLFPRGAEILHSEVGTAPGFRLFRGGATIDFVPGVPREFGWFVDRYSLVALAALGGAPVVQRGWSFFGLGESHLAERLAGLDWGCFEVHYIPRFPEVRLFIASRDESAGELARIEEQIERRVGSFLVATDDDSLEDSLGRALLARGWTLATAESCTGGRLGQMITSVPGSSAYYSAGFVTYSNRAKVELLGIAPETIERFGAVSAETAVQMAENALRLAKADVALSVTGVAGPAGGSAEKPVGTVFLGLASRDESLVRRLDIGRPVRKENQLISAWSALSTLLWYIEGRLPEGLVRRL